jgi:hypothetical protein
MARNRDCIKQLVKLLWGCAVRCPTVGVGARTPWRFRALYESR